MSSEKEEYWICHSCGTKFQEGEYESNLKSKTKNIERLKNDIHRLENELRDKPENLSEQLQAAKAQYDAAYEDHERREKEFVSTSGYLKFVKLLKTVTWLLIVGIFAFAFVKMIVFINDEDVAWGIAMGAAGFLLDCVLIYITEETFEKAKRYINWKKAGELERLKNDVDSKKAIYQKYQTMQNNADSYNGKLSELSRAEQDLEQYRGDR